MSTICSLGIEPVIQIANSSALTNWAMPKLKLLLVKTIHTVSYMKRYVDLAVISKILTTEQLLIASKICYLSNVVLSSCWLRPGELHLVIYFN